jgi:DNA-binding transcriptional MerR regulator
MKLLKIGEAARALGVSTLTMKRWENGGRLKPLRNPNGVRFYRPKDIERLRRWREPKADPELRRG